MHDDLIEEFMAETRDGLDALDLDILLLEKNPKDIEIIHRIFRLAHTIKGGSGFLSLPQLGQAAHTAETLLESYRNGQRRVTAESITEILQAFDRVRAEMPVLSSGEQRPVFDAVSSLRVNAEVMESLLESLAETMLARNHLSQKAAEEGHQDLAAELQKLDRSIGAMQKNILRARLQPVRRAWEKLPRLVRDTSLAMGKSIRLEMQGGETEIDRQILEHIRDPLAHLIRNAVDHGIEKPTLRTAMGKKSEGVIRLQARQESGLIVLDISDDGRGFDLDAIRRRVVDMKMATEIEAQNFSSEKILSFIFKAGFSTAQTVTDVSGRGVGLDVVRENVAQVGGTVAAKNMPHGGACFTLRLPLTLAILPCLIIQQGLAHYALPQTGLREIVRLDAQVPDIFGQHILRWRDREVPLFSLPSAENTRFAIVFEFGNRLFALGTDNVRHMEDIIVRPLPTAVQNGHLFSGSAITNNGGVMLIIDTASFLDRVNEIPVAQEVTKAMDMPCSYLVFEQNGALKGISLTSVAKIENLNTVQVEKTTEGWAMQSCGRIVPLHSFAEGKLGHVITARIGEKTIGIIADRLIDISSTESMSDSGQKIIHGRIVEILDEKEKIFPARRVLLVDDSDFFKNILLPVLKDAGYETQTTENAASALELCRTGARFDVIISDIEMPGMNGLDFARQIRAVDSRWRHVPLLALSAHATERDRALGQAAGFDDYITKFDSDSLLQSLSRVGASCANI